MTKVKQDTKKIAALKEKDKGYNLARKDAVTYLQGRKPAIVSVGRRYRLDIDELSQEGYEILLTCLRDFTPIFTKNDGSTVQVQFNTFFGSRLEVRAMEMRNRDPEYQARQAVTEGMSEEEKTSFREDPPLLVQHLDYEGTIQQTLKSEVAHAHSNHTDDTTSRIIQDSFFDKKLTQLVQQEHDEKKKAALLHVKAGGVYNFKEIAYHFGVTDSRASQVLNELMDAFYIQRLIDRDLKAVLIDFEKLKFTPKRVERLIANAFQFIDKERATEISTLFSHMNGLMLLYKKVQKEVKQQQEKTTQKNLEEVMALPPLPCYETLLTTEEAEKYPITKVGMRPLKELKQLEGGAFRPAVDPSFFKDFSKALSTNDAHYLALTTEDGTIIDGNLRVCAAQDTGRTEILCLTIKIPHIEHQRHLRIALNARLHSANKLEMFYAIATLSDMGLSQQKIATLLNTGRTNVLVYCKVKEKATPPLCTLFKDGYIQITNAATCADLTPKEQERIVLFIRRYGKAWSKGKNFSALYAAAISNKIAALEKTLPPQEDPVETTTQHTKEAMSTPTKNKLEALEKQLDTYTMALKDQEIWAAQREGVINQQREELTELRAALDTLRRETEAAELIKFGDPKALDNEIKQIQEFFTVAERLAATIKNVELATKDAQRLEIRHHQATELTALFSQLEKAVNTLGQTLNTKCENTPKDIPNS